VFHISIWGVWSFIWGAKSTKDPHGDGTVLVKFVEFCGRQERISKKQDGRLVGRTPSFRGEYSQLFIYKLRVFLDYSNHKQFFLFKAFAPITSAPPLEKSWLRPG